jgi:hypothetical protein
VSLCEIHDVEIVPDTGPIDGREIVTKDFERVFDPAYGNGGEEGEKVVGFPLRIFPDLSTRMSATGAARRTRSRSALSCPLHYPPHPLAQTHLKYLNETMLISLLAFATSINMYSQNTLVFA